MTRLFAHDLFFLQRTQNHSGRLASSASRNCKQFTPVGSVRSGLQLLEAPSPHDASRCRASTAATQRYRHFSSDERRHLGPIAMNNDDLVRGLRVTDWNSRDRGAWTTRSSPSDSASLSKLDSIHCCPSVVKSRSSAPFLRSSFGDLLLRVSHPL